MDAAIEAIQLSNAIRYVVQEDWVVFMKQGRLCHPIEDMHKNSVTPDDPWSLLGELSTDFEKIERSPDPAFLHNHNPVYCGMETLNILVSMENVGVDLSNVFCSLAPMAHLYNALQQWKLLKEPWPAMDLAIELNLGLLFNGALPTTAHRILSQYLLCLKWPVTAFSRNYRGQSPKWNTILKKLDSVHVAAESSKYIKAYLDGKDSAMRFLHNIMRQVKNGRNHGTLLEMLAVLRDSMPPIVSRLKVDLVTLSRQCADILRAIRFTFGERLSIQHVMEGTEFGDVYGKWNYIVLTIFDEAFPPKGLRGASQPEETQQFTISAEVTNNSIAKIKSQQPVQPFDVVAATYRGKSYYDNKNIPKGILRAMERPLR